MLLCWYHSKTAFQPYVYPKLPSSLGLTDQPREKPTHTKTGKSTSPPGLVIDQGSETPSHYTPTPLLLVYGHSGSKRTGLSFG